MDTFKYDGWNITTEDPMLYKAGGFHPVRLNDVFNSRYKVFRKLGWATQSTVWLAEDLITGKYVALKIGMAKYSNVKSMETTFERADENHPGASHLLVKLDSFVFEGPNGSHLVLVFKPLGRNFQDLLEDITSLKYQKDFELGEYGTKEWSARFCKEACRQIVLAIDYLHFSGLMHRDIHPANILLDLTYDLNKRTKDEIQADIWDEKEDGDGDQSTMTVENWSEMNFRLSKDRYINILSRKDGKPMADNEPPYTIAGACLEDELKLAPEPPTSGFNVKLIDLGLACKIEDCSNEWPYPLDIRAPEIIARQPYNEKADIWALACTMFRIITTHPLLSFRGYSDPVETDNEHMLALIDRFGKLPDDIRSRWAQANDFLDKEGKITIDGYEEYNPDSPKHGGVWQGLQLAKPSDMSEADAKLFCDLMVKMLDWDPSKRLSTKEVLSHAWFQG